jgi:hypothetical protein
MPQRITFRFLALPTSLVFAAFAAPIVSAHQADSGWTYPLECCSNQDCRAISASKVTEGPDGYVVEISGEQISYADGRIRDSPDGEHHWCSVGGRDNGRTICLFVPPASF